MESSNKEANFFEKFGLEVTTGEVEVGQIYPIYGMITDFISEVLGEVEVMINFSIRARMMISDQKGLNTLRERALEPGIFISTVTSKDDGIRVDCQTVVFGRKQEYNA